MDQEAAFISRRCPEIFHSIEHANDIWLPDPFDVPTIHAEAREVFGRLAEQALVGQIASGRILVIRGEAGSGKTHLMRAFRNMVHRDESAFFAYMQMTTSAQNYERYLLQNLIDSLQQPYHPEERTTSLKVLSNRLTEMVPKKRVVALRDAETGTEAAPIVHELTDRLVDRNDLPPVDPDLIRALLFLQVGRPSVVTKVNKYLRAEALTDYDRETLGGIAPLHLDDAPLRHVTNLAKLIRTPLNRALVVCIDQLEDMFNLDAAKERFPRAMSAVTSLAELPSVVVVVSCLEQFYVNVKQHLSTSTIHRLEQDPPPVKLLGMRSRPEAQAMIAKRLNRLREDANLPCSDDSIEPFPPSFLERVAGMHTRNILAECLAFRTKAMEAGRIPRSDELDPEPSPPPTSTLDVTTLAQDWNDAVQQPVDVPEDEGERALLLRQVLPLLGTDIDGAGPKVRAVGHPSAFELAAPWIKPTYVAVTEAGTRGGGLLRQMETHSESAQEKTLVLLRSDTFGSTPKAKTTLLFARILADGGRGVTVSDSDWRRLVAFRDFHEKHQGDRAYREFRRTEQPLFRIAALKELLDAEHINLEREVPGEAIVDSSKVGDDQTGSSARDKETPNTTPTEDLTMDLELKEATGPLQLGNSTGRRAAAIEVDVQQLKRHAAFLGSTGSGKTTAATMVIEQLLARGIPAILVDRKGDLCGYGLPHVWTDPVEDPTRRALRDLVRQKTEVQIFTPGNSAGRNLTVPLVPKDFQDLLEEERKSAARLAAGGLVDMMNYGSSQAHQGGKVAIQKTISYLGSLGETPTLPAIAEALRAPDADLVVELRNFTRFAEKTAMDLEILRENKEELLREDAETLDVDRLLRPTKTGKTPLSIVSTKFLGAESDVQFWVAQMLMQVSRWLDKNPTTELQGVVLLDEADLYLPATKNPVSKRPVEDLLRRARSKGFGVLLATQSPGDLDYKCRDNIVTWLVGLIAQQTALKKLEPMFRDTPVDLNKLAAQKVGEFHFLHEGNVQPIKTHRNAVPLPSQVSDEEILRLARG